MPLPKPRKNEKEKDFIDRCMADNVMNSEYKDPKQRRVVCQSQWDKKDKNTDAAPTASCVFSQADAVRFAESDDAEDKKNNFSIVGYSGQVIPDHWFWGNLAFDLEGLKFAKRKTPVLEQHFTDRRIGFATKQVIDDKVLVEGPFLSNENAQRLKRDIQEGFPMEASLFVPPTVVEHVKDGESVQVNGHTLRGPGTVFRKAVIKDVSFCTFGADSHTKSMAFAEGGKREIEFNVITKTKESEMDEQKKLQLTTETFAAEYPELHKQITAGAQTEGEKAAMDRFNAIQELAPDDPGFVVEQFKAGKSVDEAKTTLIEKLRDSKTKAAGAGDEAAEQEFSDEQKKPEKKDSKDTEGKPATFDEAVERHMKQYTSDKSEVAKKAAAVRFCVANYPELHEKYLEENTHEKKD